MWFDIILGAVIMGCMVLGTIKGGIREIFGILGVIMGIFIGTGFYNRLALLLPINNLTVGKVVSFIIIFVLISLAIYFIGFLIYSFLHLIKVGVIDRLIGLILGTINGLICLLASLSPQGNKIVSKSKIAPIVFTELRLLKHILPQEFQPKLKWHTPREATLWVSIPTS
ncbi:MAG: CvpA family protein [Candidatus Stahlbacteria bacterium]|nr:CvpA family protein [Candidatus Stahlbacteria bacterium]